MKDGKYEDMLSMQHPVSSKHPRMSMQDRAAQFSPFAALTGYDDAIIESGRLTDEKKLFEESQDTELERKLQELFKKAEQHPLIECTYFQRDLKKEGGAYMHVKDRLKKMDVYAETILLENGKTISFSDLSDIALS